MAIKYLGISISWKFAVHPVAALQLWWNYLYLIVKCKLNLTTFRPKSFVITRRQKKRKIENWKENGKEIVGSQIRRNIAHLICYNTVGDGNCCNNNLATKHSSPGMHCCAAGLSNTAMQPTNLHHHPYRHRKFKPCNVKRRYEAHHR